MSVDIDRMNMRLRTSAGGNSAESAPASDVRGEDREELKRLLRPIVLEILEELLSTELRIRGR